MVRSTISEYLDKYSNLGPQWGKTIHRMGIVEPKANLRLRDNWCGPTNDSAKLFPGNLQACM